MHRNDAMPDHFHYTGIKAWLEAMPTDDVQPVKHGRWIWDDEGYHCSECFFHAYDNSLEIMQGIWSYCPHCGAKMDGAE